MGEGKRQEIKGRVKEAAGTLSGDKSLKAKGQADQVAGKAKQVVDDAAKSVRKAVDKVKDLVSGKDAKKPKKR